MEQDIIEKKPASPLATALLGVTTLCLLAAVVLAGLRLNELGYKEKPPTEAAKVFYDERSAPYKKIVGELGLSAVLLETDDSEPKPRGK